MAYAQSPKGRAKIEQARRQLAARGAKRKPRRPGAAPPHGAAAWFDPRHAHRRPADRRRCSSDAGRRGRLRPPRRPQPRALGGAARLLDPARRRPPRAGRRLRRRRLRARHGRLGVALDHDRPGRGQHARRGRRGVGLALADPRDRHRHPGRAAPARRLPRRAARDDRPGRDVRAGRRRTRSPSPRAEDLAALGRARDRAAPPPPDAARLPRRADRPARRAEAAGRADRHAPCDRPPRRRDGGAVDADRRGRAAADLGRLRARSTRATASRRSPSGSRAPVITTYGARRPAAPGPPVRGRHAAARRAGRARCGTRPTS